MMDQIKIFGGYPLRGAVQVSGSKNAALPILFSCLLTDQPCVFQNIPRLQDIRIALDLLKYFGVKLKEDPDSSTIFAQAHQVHSFEAPYSLVRAMRASIIALGPLLARFGQAKISLPGGCAIGARPIDFHLSGLQRLGAHFDLEEGYITASAKKLVGNRVALEFPSVGATENIMMAAVLAEGETRLENCAKEPEIVDLALALKSMGAQIQGAGTETILIQGKANLQAAHHRVMGDRLEAGTFLVAAFATLGEIDVENISSEALESVIVKLEEAGAIVLRKEHGVFLKATASRPQATHITTLPFPGFPTDMQAQWMALMCRAQGVSVITETIFENRFMHVPELSRLGAEITIRGNSAVIQGTQILRGAPLMATDIRASAGLIIAGLCAQGETTLEALHHLDRGYENLEFKLQQLGAKIQREKPIWEFQDATT